MANFQPGILAPVPAVARYLSFTAAADGGYAGALRALRNIADGDAIVTDCGLSLVRALAKDIAGLRDFPASSGPGFEVPSTPAALWCWLRGDDRGDLVHRARQVAATLAPGFTLARATGAYFWCPPLANGRLDLRALGL